MVIDVKFGIGITELSYLVNVKTLVIVRLHKLAIKILMLEHNVYKAKKPT